MKFLITLIILTYAPFTNAQDLNIDLADSLKVVQLDYFLLDSNDVRMLDEDIDINRDNYFYYTKDYNIHLVYTTENKNQWTSISLPFESGHITSFKKINIDNKDKPELVIKGFIQEYGSGGGVTFLWMMIISTDNVPTQIFKIFYGCSEESFGERDNDGKDRYYNLYERSILINENGIMISKLDKKSYPFENSIITEIPKGYYILKGGCIQKIK